MELSVKFTITELELLETLLKHKYQQLNNTPENDLLDIYKKLYLDSLRRIRDVLYALQDEPKLALTKKHPTVTVEGKTYQMLNLKN